MLLQDAGDELEELVHDLDVVVLQTVLHAEVIEGGEAGVGDAQNGVTVAGDDLTVVETVPGVFRELLVCRNAVELLAHIHNEAQTLLIGQSVERSSQTRHGCRDGVVRIAQGGANDVGRHGAHIAPFMVGVEDEVQANKFLPCRIVTHTQHVGEVVRQVIVVCQGGNDVTLVEADAIDGCGNAGHRGDQADGIVKQRLPEGVFAGALVIGGAEFRLALHGEQTYAEHGHRMGILRHGLERVDNILGDRVVLCERRTQLAELLGRCTRTRHQHPEGLFRRDVRKLKDRNVTDAKAFVGRHA